jgi:plasmid stability protein
VGPSPQASTTEVVLRFSLEKSIRSRQRNRFGSILGLILDKTKEILMSTITLKNIPTSLHEKLRRNAALHHRSLNNEIIACLESATSSVSIDPNQLLAQARLLRQQVKQPLTETMLEQFKQDGRL